MTYADTVKFIVAMIIMMNPLGSLSIFLQLTERYSRKHQRQIAINAGIAMAVILLVTVWTGKGFLSLLGISIPAFRFAGGIILLLMGLSMLQSKESAISHTPSDNEAAKEQHSIAVVPLALPIIVGPGTISTVIIFVGDFYQSVYKLSISVICAALAFAMAAMLYFAHPIANFVGPAVIKVVIRIMGMIIMAIAVGMLAEGLMGLFPALH